MRPLTFPYLEYKGYFSPIIPVGLNFEKKEIISLAYVDSGATYSIFNIAEAARLGLDYQKGQEILITVGDGGLIPVYLWQIKAKIEEIEFPATVGFSPKLGVGFNLLGRKSFFEEFDVCFSESKKEVVFCKKV